MPLLKKGLKGEVDRFVEELGFSSEREFINKSVEDKILELKKQKFIERSDRIERKLKAKGFSKKDILKDFF